MAAVDFVELALEESPLNEQTFDDAVTPSRVSTNKVYLPARSARLALSPAHLSRADEMRGILGSVPDLIDAYAPAGALSERAYWKDMTWLFSLAGFLGTFTAGGATVPGGDATTATGVNALNSTTVNVGDTSLFPATGTFILTTTGPVLTAVTYTGKTATSFTGCSNHPATTGGEAVNDHVPTGASKWVLNKRDSITAQTAQVKINYAAENNLLEGHGYGISQLGLNAAGELTAELMGLYLRRLVADTTTVPVIPASAIPPARRGDLYLSQLAGGATPTDFSIAFANGLERYYGLSLLPSSDFPSEMDHGEEQVRVTGSIPKRIFDADDWDALKNATTFAAKARWRSKKVIGATAAFYTLWIDMPACQFVGGDADEQGNKRRVGASYDFFAGYDETAGYDVRITLTNDVVAIATYA